MIGFNFKGQHFDSSKVLSSTDKATRRVLSKFGAFVRTVAKSSIRRRKKVSPPGSPPTNRTGFLKKYLFFGYDPTKQSVVIGPAKLNKISFGQDGYPVKGAVPEVLEHGGSIVIWEHFKHGIWQRIDLRSKRRAAPQKRKRTINIEARPFMGPALEKESPKLSNMWKDSIK